MRRLILLLLAGCTACSTGAAPERPAPARSDTAARIRALAGMPSCTDDAQCHTLALGARACGGPESYLPWSSVHTRQAEIQALGERYKEEQRAANAASGAMSTCQFLPDPGAVCRAGTCQLGTGTGASVR